MSETRATAASGGQKGRKLARFALLPFDALWAVAEHFGIGANKYEDRNWERGYPWSWSKDALERHFALWWQGEERDAETGSYHIVAVAWHALVLVAFYLRGSGTDDRPLNGRLMFDKDGRIVTGRTEIGRPSPAPATCVECNEHPAARFFIQYKDGSQNRFCSAECRNTFYYNNDSFGFLGEDK